MKIIPSILFLLCIPFLLHSADRESTTKSNPRLTVTIPRSEYSGIFIQRKPNGKRFLLILRIYKSGDTEIGTKEISPRPDYLEKPTNKKYFDFTFQTSQTPSLSYYDRNFPPLPSNPALYEYDTNFPPLTPIIKHPK